MTAVLTPPRTLYAVAAVLLLAATAAAAVAHGLWAPALIGLLAPDLPLFFGGGRGLARGQLHPRAVPAYNAVHRLWGPLALIAVGTLAPVALVAGLAWAAHVAVDRAVGYGLRDATGFQR